MKEMDTIGFLELNSIAKGIEAVDYMLKAADTQLLMAKASCPGKYYIMISGQVGSTERSMEVGVEIGGRHVVGQLLIPRVHPSVIKAVNMADIPEKTAAIGVLEYYSAAGSIIAADYAVKAADVHLLAIQLGTGIAGKSFVVMTGDVASVEAGVEAGANGAKDEAMLINKIVLPNPRKELVDSLIM
ncbi:microcompartment protein CcmL/EutN [Enterococcus sp. PF1-24]|uniref:BMC domain-containing protein n=1 Tax=unclassified Enterococcus TaxID=2608891 RepID=UPI00247386BD|nr:MULTISPECIES: BMC domain-containing protein [unclassified Enterococcus]MDH6365605.1 microcompartment protein CcmL/EutN [Enterococcus sp. PFB1-1]MDH6402707.1 microcompartment protein CcmL/EutN [Enterococcus sp. PF1-24]